MPYAKHMEDAALPQVPRPSSAPCASWWAAMAEFLMPNLAADMSAGTLVAWRKKPGDAVTRGDIIAEVETDKGVIDIEAFTTGVIEKILVQPGETVPTGSVLAIINDGASPEARAPVVSPPTPAAAPAPVRRASRAGRPRAAADLAARRGSSRPSSASIPRRSAARDPAERSGRRTSSRRRPPGRRRHRRSRARTWIGRRGSDRRSPPPWRAPSARCRTTT